LRWICSVLVTIVPDTTNAPCFSVLFAQLTFFGR
jgi:hypothetical protein